VGRGACVADRTAARRLFVDLASAHHVLFFVADAHPVFDAIGLGQRVVDLIG
jgi:hypothetical protein